MGTETRLTRKYIELMALSKPVLYKAIRVGQSKGLSWIETMYFAVECLIKYSDDQLENAIRAEELSVKPISFTVSPQLKELKALAATVADGNFNHADVIAEAKRLSNADA